MPLVKADTAASWAQCGITAEATQRVACAHLGYINFLLWNKLFIAKDVYRIYEQFKMYNYNHKISTQVPTNQLKKRTLPVPLKTLGWTSTVRDESLSHRLLWLFRLLQLRRLACQAPLSVGFSRQEYWSGSPLLLQGIFLTQESILGPLHCIQILYWLSCEESLSGIPLLLPEVTNHPLSFLYC